MFSIQVHVLANHSRNSRCYEHIIYMLTLLYQTSPSYLKRSFLVHSMTHFSTNLLSSVTYTKKPNCALTSSFHLRGHTDTNSTYKPGSHSEIPEKSKNLEKKYQLAALLQQISQRQGSLSHTNYYFLTVYYQPSGHSTEL